MARIDGKGLFSPSTAVAFVPRLFEPGSESQTPVRTVYNVNTRQHEQIPITQFQQLLQQGKIEPQVCPDCGDARCTNRLL